MQKGKDVCGGTVPRKLVIITTIFTAVFLPCRGFSEVPGLPPWMEGRGRSPYPGERVNPLFHYHDKATIHLMASLANPYSMDGLNSYYFKAGYSSLHYSVWLGWSLMRHHLYRQDDFTLVYSRYLWRRYLQFYLGPQVKGAGVRGFSGRYRTGCLYGWTVNLLGGGDHVYGGEEGNGDNQPRDDLFLSAGWECSTGRFGEKWRSCCGWGVSMGLGRFRAVWHRRREGWGYNENSTGLEIWLCEHFSIMWGYIFTTHQFSSAACLKSGSMIIAVSCRNHPTLGMTFSIGMGRWWK